MKAKTTVWKTGRAVVRVGSRGVGAVGLSVVLAAEAIHGEGRVHIHVEGFALPPAFTVNQFHAATTSAWVGGFNLEQVDLSKVHLSYGHQEARFNF